MDYLRIPRREDLPTEKEIISQNKSNYLSAIEGDDDTYEEKLDWLIQRWATEEDGEASRVIKPILFLSSAPFYQSVVADNLSFFSSHYQRDNKHLNSNQLLALSCLCGSRKTAEFLLNQMQLSYLSDEHEYILGYVSASANIGWAQDIAKILAKNGRTMPQHVYAMSYDDEMTDAILKIFEMFAQQHKSQEVFYFAVVGETQMSLDDFLRQASPHQIEELEKKIHEHSNSRINLGPQPPCVY